MGIDPGSVQSAYIIWNGECIIGKGKVENGSLLWILEDMDPRWVLAIEMVASYGMPVGKDVFDTCVWIGRFLQRYVDCTDNMDWGYAYRKDIKMHFCNSTRAKDSNITTALVDRFGNRGDHGKYGKGTKKDPGFFYGFSKDMWQAFAVAVYHYDMLLGA